MKKGKKSKAKRERGGGGERYARAKRKGMRERGRAKNSRRTRPSKWAGECKSIPRRGARNCAPTLECGNPFSKALLHVLVERRYRHQHTAHECPPRVRHCNGATAQWDRHCSGACIIASDVSDPENRLLLRDPLRGITFPRRATRSNTTSLTRGSSVRATALHWRTPPHF